MSGGSGQLQKVAEDLDAADKDPGTGVFQPDVIRDALQGGSAGGVSVWVVYVGADPPYWTGPCGVSAQGCAADHEEKADATGRGGL